MAGGVVRVVYGAVSWLYPARVRRIHGDEMAAAVEWEWQRRTGQGLRGVAAFAVWLAVDIARSIGAHFVMPAVRRVRLGRRRRAPQRAYDRKRREKVHNTLRDLRHATRALTRKPAFTATAALTLALGIGANTAVFSVVDRVLLRPLPYPESENLVILAHPVPGYGSGEWGLSQAGYFYFKEHSRALADLGAYLSPPVVLTGGDQAERVSTARITASVLSTLQVAPMLGRGITPDDDVPGAQPVVLLAHDLWMRRYGGDSSVVGRTIQLDGEPEEVIGVMPPGFHFPQQSTVLWRPLRLDPTRRPVNSHFYSAVGRLRAGVTTEDAVADLRSLVARFPDDMPSAYSTRFFEESGFDVTVRTLLDDMVQDVDRALWIVLGTVALVLFMACANIANLFSVRAEGRRRELAVRTALGADRRDLLWLYLAEAFVLAVMGGVLGIGLAYGGVELLTAYAPAELPRMNEIGLDHRAIIVAGVLAAVSALFFGTLPALRGGDAGLTEDLKEGARNVTAGRNRRRIRSGLVLSQIAIALVLMAASGLLLRSFLALRDVELGFDPENVFTARLTVVPVKYENAAAAHRFFETARERLEALPMVSSAGTVAQLEIVDRAYDNATAIADLPGGGEMTQIVDEKFAGPGYFETMRMPLVEGRYLERSDMDGTAPGAVITQSMAEEYWPGQSALGKRVRPLFTRLPWHSVVGVIEDVRTEGIRQAPKPTVYFPVTLVSSPSLAFVIRSDAPPSAVLPAVQRVVWAIDPDVPIAQATTMDQIVADDMASTSFTFSLLGLAAALALILGAVGIYGVISYGVTQRAPEIGIRLALGARTGEVRWMVLGETLRLAAAGMGLGLVAALALNRVMNALLFGVQSTDPATLAAVCVALAAVAALAGYLPARRAARVDPLEALRAE